MGDCHGCYKTYEYVLFKMLLRGGRKGMDCSLQLGDMAIGFESNAKYSKNGKQWPPEIGVEHKFIRGNHDDPASCRKHSNYLGDWVL